MLNENLPFKIDLKKTYMQFCFIYHKNIDEAFNLHTKNINFVFC